jgi:hypothetical protein
MSDIDDNVKKMVLALPLFDIGDNLHDIFVNKVKGSTPGSDSGTHQSFIDIFFPNWQAINFTSDIAGKTGLNDSWWSDFAVAVLCQSMAHLTHDLYPQLLHEQIDTAVDTYNKTLNSNIASFYSYVFSETFSDFSVPFNAVDRNIAKTQYKQVLKDAVNIHILWYAQDMWKNPDWEMFHHFIKLMALGASDSEIDQLINELEAAGLLIPNDVDKGNWKSFNGFLQNHPRVDCNDIDSVARDGILKTIYLRPQWGGQGSSIPEGNSFEFTSDKQPGSKYRQVPKGGSCFARGTIVLMHDFSTKLIETIQPGDQVASLNGAREVAFVSTPLRRERTLYSFNGLPFHFTATHPFINAESSEFYPQLLSANPKELKSWVPTLAKGGIAKLENSARVIQVQALSSLETKATTIEMLSQHKADNSEDELLYDLILQPDHSGTFEYVAGSEGNLFLVASEIPRIYESPYLTYTILEMLSISVPAFIKKFELVGRNDFYKEIEKLKPFVLAELLYRSLLEIKKYEFNRLTESQTSVDLLEPLKNYVAQHMKSFVTPERGYNWILGGVYEMLVSALGEEIESTVELGWRCFGQAEGNIIAVSIADLHLDSLYPIEFNSRLRLVVQFVIDDECQEVKTIVDSEGRENSRFVRYFDQVIYLDAKWISNTTSRRLLFDFFVDENTKPKLTASAYLPHQFQPPYRRFSPRVHTSDEDLCGRLFFDIRLLCEKDLEDEKMKMTSWHESSKLCFSQVLGRQMGNFLSKQMLN